MNKTEKIEWKIEPGRADRECLDLGLLRLEVHPSYDGLWVDNSPKSWRVQLWAVNGGGEYDGVDMCVWDDDLLFDQPSIEAAKALGIARAKAILTESLKALENAQ